MFQSLYCGICLAIKSDFGNIPRLTTNYDITVFGLIAIEALKPQVEFGTVRCIADPRKKGVIRLSEFMRRLSAVNILLTYYKATDDVIDSGGKKKLMRRLLKRPYEKARRMLPESDRIIAEGYARLRGMERDNVASIDRVSDCFSSLLAQLIGDFIKEKRDRGEMPAADYENYCRMCYNIGKFVYLADALDDIDKDLKKKNYNPFLAVYPEYKRGGRQALMDAHGGEIGFCFTSAINRAIECSNAITFTQVNDLLRNILYKGLRRKADQLLRAEKQLPAPKF